jgi:hypothetical protein
MKKFESLMVGASLVASGLAHRRAGAIGRQVSELSGALAAPATPAPQAAPAPAGMPLPTGYGLQVRGPAGEELLVPVCLPPGFELESLMLAPEFLPREEHARVPAAAPASAPAPAAEQPVERIAGTLQYVYGAGPAYQTQVEHVPQPAPAAAAPQTERVPVPFARAGVETHRLA